MLTDWMYKKIATKISLIPQQMHGLLNIDISNRDAFKTFVGDFFSQTIFFLKNRHTFHFETIQGHHSSTLPEYEYREYTYGQH